MPIYIVEQYEVSATKLSVKAASEAEAIQKILNGEGDAISGMGPEYIETLETMGLPVEEYPELAEELRELGVSCEDGIIPSIRSVEEE